ncbi:MAG: isochorismate synthase [Chloroflexota bacterium]|mgnify:CR=1 FL=1
MNALRLPDADVSAHLGEALRALIGPDAGATASHLVSASIPIAPLDPIALYAAAIEAREEAALLMRPVDTSAFVGIGAAWSIGPAGDDRFRVAETAWRELLNGARIGTGPEIGAVGPVLLGGLGFSGRTPDASDPWGPFGASSLALHSITVAATPGGTWLTGSLLDGGAGQPSTSGFREAGRLEALFDRLSGRARELAPSAAGLAARPVTAPLRIVHEQPDEATWDGLVGLLSGAVGRGRLEKVVLARRVDITSPLEFDVPNALRRLALSAPESTIYAFRREGRTFLGATPERLVRTEGRRFWSAAIAGTVARGVDAATDAAFAAQVLASDKEREEHGVVVATLREQLLPITTELRISEAPRVLALRHVQHLVSEVEGTLRERVGLLQLAERLHPTPAVGGEPRELALAMIDEHEGFDRGWYAGPIGWLGADGDGELSVALRCGIVERTKATLFAGCGIVADSDPDREWAESTIKLRAVASALGRPEEGL